VRIVAKESQYFDVCVFFGRCRGALLDVTHRLKTSSTSVEPCNNIDDSNDALDPGTDDSFT